MKGLAAVSALALVAAVGVTSAGASTRASGSKVSRPRTSGHTAGVSFSSGASCAFTGTALTKVSVASPKVAARKTWGAQKVDLVAELQVKEKGRWKTVATRHHTSTARTSAKALPPLDAFGTRSGVSASLRSLRVVESVRWLRPTDGKEEGRVTVTVSATCTPPAPAPVASVAPSVAPTMDSSMPGMTMSPVAPVSLPASPAPPASPSPSPSPLPPAVTTFHIGPGHAFSDQVGTIHAGDTVAVVDDDQGSHTFTLTLGGSQAFDSGNLDHGDTVSFVAPATGTYAISCDYHSDMHGTLTVS